MPFLGIGDAMNFLDKAIETISPEWGKKRAISRQQIKIVNEFGAGYGYGRYGASKRRNAVKDFNEPPMSANEDIIDNLKTLRARSRSLFMGAPLAVSALKTIRTNVVGSGLALNSHIDAKFLGLTEEQAKEWEANTEREWKLWADTIDCDAERKQTFFQLQGSVLLFAIMSGDVFATLPIKKRIGSPYDLRVSLIEADRVCDPQFGILPPESVNIIDGVEFDEHGAPIAYYIANRHPNSYSRLNLNLKQEWHRVEAFGAKTGRRNVLHIMADVERPEQKRGVPMLAPVIETLKQLSRYTDAELMAAVVAGMFTVFIKSNTPQTPLSGLMNTPPGMMPGEEHEKEKRDDISLGNGAIVSLDEGEEIQTANPSRPITGFHDFVDAVAQQIGAALEIPYELLLKHFTASYSASRGALLEAWKMFRMRREWLIGNFCQPVYEEWLTEAILKGRIQAPGFFDDPAYKAAWCGAEWFGDCQGQLDPLKEANAAKVRVEEGFSTREREAAELTGMKFDDLHAQRVREENMRKADGLIPDMATLAAAPVEEQKEENEDDGESDE